MLIQGEGLRDARIPEDGEEEEDEASTQTVYVIHPNFSAE